MVKLFISLSAFALLTSLCTFQFCYFFQTLPRLYCTCFCAFWLFVHLLSLSLLAFRSQTLGSSISHFLSSSFSFFPPLRLDPVQSDPIVVFLPVSQGQHFRDLLIGLELSIPSGWIAEHRCKSPPAWKAVQWFTGDNNTVCLRVKLQPVTSWR